MLKHRLLQICYTDQENPGKKDYILYGSIYIKGPEQTKSQIKMRLENEREQERLKMGMQDFLGMIEMFKTWIGV